MKKSVYSLVLMDDVVDAIDKLAYSMNTSRSNLINQILAEKVSYITPEKRIQDIFTRVCKIIDNDMNQISNAVISNSTLSLKSPVRYKYRPTVRYSVELYRNPKNAIGKLKVSMRTQNESLIQLINRFFVFWSQLEEQYIAPHYPDGIEYSIENGKYERIFKLSPASEYSPNSAEIGNAIGNYINTFDVILKTWFESEKNQTINGLYKNYFDHLRFLI